MTSSPIKRIVIVGGGTAGWSAAACMQRFLAKRDVAITLVESAQIGTVGVGEASIPNIRNFNAYIGLDELDFVESTGGTFKLGIRFDDWRERGQSFFHPFGSYGVDLDGLDFHQCLFAAQQRGFNADLSAFSLPIALAAQNRFAQPSPNPEALLSQFGYAFHFDAGRYARRLRKFATDRGVTHVEGMVEETLLDSESGFINAIRLINGETLEADLFIDCSGFRALLIEQALQTGYKSWQHWLPCDRAVAMPCAHANDALPPYTVATAREAGWSWAIPLQHRIGNGYVYASDFVDDETSIDALTDAMANTPLAEPNRQRFTAGMRKQFWNRNCVALGLASGFMEPLESTSINLVHRALSILMDHFPDATCDPRLARMANDIFAGEQERIRDFLILHYKLSRRNDTPFWRHIRETAIPESLAAKIDAYCANGTLLQDRYESFRPESWLTIYEGFGLRPESLDTRLAEIDPTQIERALATMQANIQSGATQALAHRDFVERYCPAPEPEPMP